MRTNELSSGGHAQTKRMDITPDITSRAKQLVGDWQVG